MSCWRFLAHIYKQLCLATSTHVFSQLFSDLLFFPFLYLISRWLVIVKRFLFFSIFRSSFGVHMDTITCSVLNKPNYRFTSHIFSVSNGLFDSQFYSLRIYETRSIIWTSEKKTQSFSTRWLNVYFGSYSNLLRNILSVRIISIINMLSELMRKSSL